MAGLAGKLSARRKDCAPAAGKSTLNRLELSRPVPTRYHEIAYEEGAIGICWIVARPWTRSRLLRMRSSAHDLTQNCLDRVPMRWNSRPMRLAQPHEVSDDRWYRRNDGFRRELHPL
jgi:hypothetical protein